MTILHKGIRRKTTDVLDDYGQAHFLQNVRLKRVGELGRRAGLGKSTMAKLNGPVQFMIGGTSNEPYIVNGTGGTVEGNADPLPYWTGGTLRIPTGDAGQPQAPTITNISFSPASGTTLYVVGNVTATVTVVYDGLSGPLEYDWAWLVGPSVPPPGNVTTLSNVQVFNFNFTCFNGQYTGILNVRPVANPALNDGAPFEYTVL